jgi:hypothetical protein
MFGREERRAAIDRVTDRSERETLGTAVGRTTIARTRTEGAAVAG